MLQVVNYFPILPPELTARDQIIAQIRREGPAPAFQDPLSVARVFAEPGHPHLGAADTGSRKGVEQSTEYEPWKAAMPLLKAVPAIRNYRHDNKKVDLAQTNQEVKRFGQALPLGQILFHGGLWSSSGGIPVAGAMQTTQNVMSTSLIGSVAGRFMLDIPGALFWIIRICDPAPAAFVFKTRRNEKMSHEYEVLLEAGLRVVVNAVHPTSSTAIIECDISR